MHGTYVHHDHNVLHVLGAWCFGGKRVNGRPRHNTRRAYLNLVDKLKFHELDCFLANNKKANYDVYLT